MTIRLIVSALLLFRSKSLSAAIIISADIVSSDKVDRRRFLIIFILHQCPLGWCAGDRQTVQHTVEHIWVRKPGQLTQKGIVWYFVPRFWSPNRHFVPRGRGAVAVGVFSSAWGGAFNIYWLVYFTAYCTRHRPSSLGYNSSICLCMWVSVRGFKIRHADRLWQFLHCATRASIGSTTAVAPPALRDEGIMLFCHKNIPQARGKLGGI